MGEGGLNNFSSDVFLVSKDFSFLGFVSLSFSSLIFLKRSLTVRLVSGEGEVGRTILNG